MDYVGTASTVQAVGDVEKAVLIRRKNSSRKSVDLAASVQGGKPEF